MDGVFRACFEEGPCGVFDDPFGASLLCHIVFVNPTHRGWITAALPLVLAYVLGGYDDPALTLAAMDALSLNFRRLLVHPEGISGLGKKFAALAARDTLQRAGIILGAAIRPRAQNACLLTDAERFLLQQPDRHHTGLCVVPDLRLLVCRLAKLQGKLQGLPLLVRLACCRAL